MNQEIEVMPHEAVQSMGTLVGSNLDDSSSQMQIDDSQEGTEVTVNASSNPRLKSIVWKHFTKIKDSKRAACNHCGKDYAAASGKNGTSTMKSHLAICPKNPSNKKPDKKQREVGYMCKPEDEGSEKTMKLISFSQEECRIALARMICEDELSLKLVDNEGFRNFMHVAQPKFQVPSRITIAKDVMKLYLNEKQKLKHYFSSSSQMVCLTTDTWTSIQNFNYMCVTAHYIGSDWELNKKILSFSLISDHKRDTIGKALERTIKDWSISKVCTITVDNATSNTVALAYLVRRLNDWDGTILKGEFMHLRCSAHILNLIVSEGLKEIDPSIARIRATVKYVKASPARMVVFKQAIDFTNIKYKHSVCLDCPTRWNSTFLMLEIAEKFEKAFTRLEDDDPHYIFSFGHDRPPISDDWERARVFIKFLQIFYEVTLNFSSSLHVTSNAFFEKLYEIQQTLHNWMQCDDIVLKTMAESMKRKFDKYWNDGHNMNYFLFVAVVLDPRYKLEFVEFCFEDMYGREPGVHMLEKLKEILQRLFETYSSLHPIPPDSKDASGSMDLPSVGSSQQNASVSLRFQEKRRRKQKDVKKSELERYLEDDIEEQCDGFNILNWWRGKQAKYYILSYIAKDILPIPVSTVSSESAFSTGGRVLDQYRSSLLPTTVEALICAQNWLRHPKKSIDLCSQMNEIEQIESKLSTVVTELEKDS